MGMSKYKPSVINPPVVGEDWKEYFREETVKKRDSKARPHEFRGTLAPDGKNSLVRNDKSKTTYVKTQSERPRGEGVSTKQHKSCGGIGMYDLMNTKISGKSRTQLEKEAEENSEKNCREVVRKSMKNSSSVPLNKSKYASKAERNKARKLAKKARAAS